MCCCRVSVLEQAQAGTTGQLEPISATTAAAAAAVLNHLLVLLGGSGGCDGIDGGSGYGSWGPDSTSTLQPYSSLHLLHSALMHQLESTPAEGGGNATTIAVSFQQVTALPCMLCRLSSGAATAGNEASNTSAATAASTGALLVGEIEMVWEVLDLLRRVNLFCACTVAATWLLLMVYYESGDSANADPAGPFVLLLRCWLLRAQELQLASDVALGTMHMHMNMPAPSSAPSLTSTDTNPTPSSVCADAVKTQLLELHRCCTLFCTASKLLQSSSALRPPSDTVSPQSCAACPPCAPCQAWLLLLAPQRHGDPLYSEQCRASLSAVTAAGAAGKDVRRFRAVLLALVVDRLLRASESEEHIGYLEDHLLAFQ